MYGIHWIVIIVSPLLSSLSFEYLLRVIGKTWESLHGALESNVDLWLHTLASFKNFKMTGSHSVEHPSQNLDLFPIPGHKTGRTRCRSGVHAGAHILSLASFHARIFFQVSGVFTKWKAGPTSLMRAFEHIRCSWVEFVLGAWWLQVGVLVWLLGKRTPFSLTTLAWRGDLDLGSR